ncbi:MULTISPECIES: response regulator [Brevibacillus]|jgi:two-component system response regulator DctR|uniref:response regulator n=1 Tax=Brevibacillus TaxID=55080 RepID=UPI000E36435D|nr:MULTISPECIES: response regulator [Bacillales]MBR8659058.1 response regulator [Brevibacillus sp. NL20B1]REK62697.1 MAG: two-component system response regulator [Brevibacillus sp.]UFJ59677.1 response regulator [Anoxybacillus sediminis]
MGDPFRVVVIEDDPMVQEVNRQFIERVPSFRVVGAASNGAEGLALVEQLKPDLVIMDIFMPVLDGVRTLQKLRTANQAVDVIVITAAKDKPTIQAMLRNGVMDYIIKPFKFERIQQALENYRAFRQQLEQEGTVSQAEVDQLLFRSAAKSPRELETLPKGLHMHTLEQIVRHLRQEKQPLSAEEVAERVGIARVTARRYLEYLEKSGRVKRDVAYGGVGRPTNRYVLV